MTSARVTPPAGSSRRFSALAIATLFVATSALAFIPPAQADSATATGWNLSAGRARTSAVTDGNGNAYVVGGWELGITAAVEKVNLATGAVSVVATLPTPRYHTSSVYANGYIWVFGGYDGTNNLNQILRVDPSSGSVVVVATLPTALSMTTAAYDGTHAYVFGGLQAVSGGNPVIRFTPSTSAVTTLSARTPLYVHGASSVYDPSSGHIYVLGGFDYSSHRRDVLRFNPSTGVMDNLGLLLPIGRYESALAWDGTYAYLFGAQTGMADTVRYHPASSTGVTMAAKMSPGRYAASAVWHNGNAYVFGGLPDNYNGNNKLTEVLRYNLAPGAPSGLSGSSTCAGAITLSWTAPGADTYSRLTGYKVYRSVNGGAEALLKDVGNTLSTTDSGASGSTYAYRVSAYSTADGEGPKSSSATITVACPPSAPLSLTATGGTRQISLSWSAPSSNGGAAVTAYKIYRGTASGSETLLAAIGSNTSFTDATLGNADTRYYKVSASNLAGEGPQSTGASATTHSPPTAPLSPSASATAVGQITVTWSAPSSNGGTAVTGYKVYRDGAFAGSPSGTTTTFVDSGRANGVAYSYRVSAVNAAGEGAQSTAASASTWAVPGAPQSVSATASAVREITVTWSAPASNGGTAVTGYTVYRDGVAIATRGVTPLSYTDANLAHGTTYSYAIAALNAVGESAQSGAASATTFSAPGAPAASASAGPGGGVISVTWTAPSSTGGTAITAYKVYRGTTAGQTTELLATLGATARSYVDSGLPAGATRYYRVTAVNAVGEGGSSAEASATTFSPPTAPRSLAATTGASGGQIVLSWQSPLSDGGSAVTQYRIYRGTTSGSLSFHTTATSASFTDTGIPAGENRCYAVSAVNVAGEGPQSGESCATAPRAPTAPLNLVASTGATAGGQIQLSWQAPADSGGPAVTTYRIHRTTVSGGTTVAIDVSGSATSYTDANLYPGIRYYYHVTAINAVGEGPASSQASARASSVSSTADRDGDGILNDLETRICTLPFVPSLLTIISPDLPLAGRCEPGADYNMTAYWDTDNDMVVDAMEPSFCLAQDPFNDKDGICVGDDYGLPPQTHQELLANLQNFG